MINSTQISYAIHDFVEDNCLESLALDPDVSKKLKQIAEDPYSGNHKEILEPIKDYLSGKEIDPKLVDVAERIRKVYILPFLKKRNI